MNFKPTAKTAGEGFVWFTSMGLTIGLSMVVCLLILIIVNGAQVFWPKRVLQLELKDGSHIGGAFIHEQKRGTGETEWQLFMGNKDVYGFSFRFVDHDQIRKIDYPGNAMEMERLEYGDGIGIPLSLRLKDGKEITTANSGFEKRLDDLVSETNDRWHTIRSLEKKDIGRINQQIEKLQVQERVLGSRSNVDQTKIEEIHKKKESFQKDYEVLAKKASELRALQDGEFLKYRLLSGEEKELPVSQIVQFYYPNRLGMFSRIGLAFQKFWEFLSEEPREANTEGGIFPAIFGTFVMTLLLSIAVTPFGVLAAIYLREYAKQGFFVRSVRIAVNNLAGVPSIVFGVFGLGFFVYVLGGAIDRLFFSDYLPTPTFGTGGILWASLTLALMTVPVVIVATEEALSAVPRGMREGSLACGASKWQTIQNVVLPASAPGILTGLILAMARGAGEVAPLMLVGVVKLAPSLPLDTNYPFLHLDQKFMHLGFHIYDLGFQSPDSEAAKPMVFATTFLLILLVVLLNLGAIVIRERLRKKFATGAF
jgi:phosphate ABC transporter, permease protein PstA